MKNLTNLLLAWMAALSAVYAQGDLKIDTIFSEYTTAHGHSYIKIAYPTMSNEAFNKSMSSHIKSYIDEMLGKSSIETLHGVTPSNKEEMKDYADTACQLLATALGKEWEEDVLKNMGEEAEDSYYNDIICEHNLDFYILNDMARYACVCVVDYGFNGGVHGFTGIFPLIVRKSDGDILSTPFKDDSLESLRQLLEKNMHKNDFGVLELADIDSNDKKAKKEMAEMIREYGTFPEPQYAWTDGKQFFIQYQQYEILPYAYGAPVIVVPMDIIMPFLTDEVKDVLGL